LGFQLLGYAFCFGGISFYAILQYNDFKVLNLGLMELALFGIEQ